MADDSASVVALAGRRVDAAGAEEARFPPADVDIVRERLGAELRVRRPAALVCAAACGADLLALDAAAALGIRRRIVLPFAPAAFREKAVVDRPGPWGRMFDTLVAEAERAGDLVVLDLPHDADGFAAGNRGILDEAARLAGPALEAWIVWNGRPRGEDDVTLRFADLAWQRGLRIRELLTVARFDTRPRAGHDRTCFVVMPFGDKPVDGREVPFDAIFATIIAPAIEAAGLPEGVRLVAYRTDRDLTPGLIDQDMFEYLERSRFVFGDITGLNPNVMFELGMRFRSRAAGTALFRQPGTKLPFDINQVKIFEYDVAQPAAARRLITRVIEEAVARNRLDSPIRRALDDRAAGVQALLREAEEAWLGCDRATARARYTEAVRLAPADPTIWLRLAAVDKEAGRWDAALAAAARATEIMPEYAEAWRERGVAEGQLWARAADRTGMPDGLASLDRAIQLNPGDFDAHASRGGILRRQRDYAGALAAYRRSSELAEGHPYPLLNMLKLEAQLEGRLDVARWREDLARAARIRERQTATDPPADRPWSFFDLAEIRLYEGRKDEALRVLEAGLRWCDDPGKLATFRGTLDTLKKAGILLDGLDELLARASR